MNLNFDKIKLEELAEQNEIKFVVLFGSRASNRQREDSDYDIAILTTPEKDIRGSLDNYNNVLFGLASVLDIPDFKIDLTNLNGASPFLKHQIVLNSVLLHGDEQKYKSFKLFSIREYIETSDLRSLERNMVLKRQKLLAEKIK